MAHRARWFVAVLVWLLISNARQTCAEPSPPVIDEPFTVFVKVETRAANGLLSRAILPGKHVRIGERFFLHAWADQPVYLYVVNYEAEGWSDLLYPETRHIRGVEASKVRVPQGTGSFVLREGHGEVRLRVMATREPLAADGCSRLRLPCPLFKLADRTSTRGSADSNAEKKGSPPPDRADVRKGTDRSGEVIVDEKEGLVSAHSEETGVAWLDFVINPEP